MRRLLFFRFAKAMPAADSPRSRFSALPVRRIAAPLLVLALTALAMLVGLSLARPTVQLAATDARAAQTLVNFGDVESNDHAAYRWSLPRSELALGGMERGPTLLTLRMAAPRPPGAPPAVTFLTDGAWRVGDFTVGGEWRRYQVLLRPAAGALKLRAAPFVPGERDRRQLGVAVTDLRAAPAALVPAAGHALAILGAPRAAALLLLPFIAFAITAALSTRGRDGTSARRFFRSPWLRVLVPSCFVLLAGLAAAYPLRAAEMLPAGWPLAAALTLAAAAPWLAAAGERAAALGERARLALVLGFALGQGLLFTFLMPPWQHYDEPAHFQYAREIADGIPRDEASIALRREITASMIEHGFYAPEIPQPPLLSDDGALRLSGGGSAAGHQPWYYMLLAPPLRLARHLDVAGQLYLARAVSVALLVTAAAAAAGVAAELTPPGHWLRWLLPLTVAALPPFVDLMTALNNDVPAAALTSLFAWGAVRMVRRGVSWGAAAWVAASALAAALVKSTAAPVLALAPLAFVVALWARSGRPWRWLVAAAALVGAVSLAAVVRWDDAAFWYRWALPTQSAPTRAALPEAPHGAHALHLSVRPEAYLHRLSAPVLPADLPALLGQRVTVGGWVWASRPLSATLGLLVHEGGGGIELGPQITVTTEPRFVAWTTRVPAGAWRVQYMLAAASAPPDAPAELYLDGAVLARGGFPAEPPALDADAAAGAWGGRRFENLVRNGSAELAGPRIHPALDQALSYYARRPLSPWIMSITDSGLGARVTLLDVVPSLVHGLFARVGWGWYALGGPGWRLVFITVTLLGLLGCARWLVAHRRGASGTGPALALLAALGLAIWGTALLRIHPLVESGAPLTSIRYAFPAIIPTMLALGAGLVALWPRRRHAAAAALVLAGALLLEAIVVARIWEYYYR